MVAPGRPRRAGVDAVLRAERAHHRLRRTTRAPGTGYTLVADGETSRPFDIGAAAYEQLRVDALKFYYTQRSGIEILDALRPGYARPAGHVGVAPNQGDTERARASPGVCDYTLDVSGGWYDAGDHGKYVVNGGISVYQLMSTYERVKHGRAPASRGSCGDGTLAIPESGNGVPDILDEARWELEFLLRMQVPAGKPLAGMAHHKIHDDAWTGLPLLPQPTTRSSASCTRRRPRRRSTSPRPRPRRPGCSRRTTRRSRAAEPGRGADGVGGGRRPTRPSTPTRPTATAAARTTTTTSPTSSTGRPRSCTSPPARSRVPRLPCSPRRCTPPTSWRAGGFDWGSTAAARPARPGDRAQRAAGPGARCAASVVEGADRYLADAARPTPYGMPYAPADDLYDWGSNNQVLNNRSCMATAYDITGEHEVPRRRAWRAWTTSSAATRSTSPT